MELAQTRTLASEAAAARDTAVSTAREACAALERAEAAAKAQAAAAAEARYSEATVQAVLPHAHDDARAGALGVSAGALASTNEDGTTAISGGEVTDNATSPAPEGRAATNVGIAGPEDAFNTAVAAARAAAETEAAERIAALQVGCFLYTICSWWRESETTGCHRRAGFPLYFPQLSMRPCALSRRGWGRGRNARRRSAKDKWTACTACAWSTGQLITRSMRVPVRGRSGGRSSSYNRHATMPSSPWPPPARSTRRRLNKFVIGVVITDLKRFRNRRGNWWRNCSTDPNGAWVGLAQFAEQCAARDANLRHLVGESLADECRRFERDAVRTACVVSFSLTRLRRLPLPLIPPASIPPSLFLQA